MREDGIGKTKEASSSEMEIPEILAYQVEKDFALQFVRDGNVAKVVTRLIHEAVEKLLEVVAQSFDSPPSPLFPVPLPVGMATDIVVRDNFSLFLSSCSSLFLSHCPPGC